MALKSASSSLYVRPEWDVETKGESTFKIVSLDTQQISSLCGQKKFLLGPCGDNFTAT